MTVNAGVDKLIAAVRRKHPPLPQLPAHPATTRAPRPVVARTRLHAPGAPPAGTTDKTLKPIVNAQIMKGWAKSKKAARRTPKRASARTRAPMAVPSITIGLEFELTINGAKHTVKSVAERED